MAFNSQYADRIWNSLYNVSIPDVLTLSPWYIKNRGIYSTGDSKRDKAMLNNPVSVYICVMDIADYFNNGITVNFYNHEDIKTVYRDINLYLTEWFNYLESNLNDDYNNYKDLISTLENLAAHIHSKLTVGEIRDKVHKPIFGNRKTINEILKVKEPEQVKEESKPVYKRIQAIFREREKQQNKKDLNSWRR